MGCLLENLSDFLWVRGYIGLGRNTIVVKNASMRDFRRLRVYRDALDFAVTIYRFTKLLPETERFGLSSQLQRAAVSVVSNIAEGTTGGNKEFARFLRISLGSANEIECQLEISSRVHDLDSSQLKEQIRKIQVSLGALLKSLK